MRRTLIGFGILALAAAGGYTVWASGGISSMFCSTSSNSVAGAACEDPSKAQSTAAQTGRPSGRFDVAMAGCRFSCATKVKYDPKDLTPQPGVETGQLTQCPVSGVVFASDVDRPHVQVAANDYVTCCETCADKLRNDPARFLN
ncbi:MAG: hypothetical protein ACREOU_15885 [Candidatus Eiseniibacteriota bacterium]